MQGLCVAAAAQRGRGGRGLGHQVPVSRGLQEAWIGVLLHQGASLPLSHVKARGRGSLQVHPGQLPGLVVYVHLWEGRQARG